MCMNSTIRQILSLMACVLILLIGSSKGSTEPIRLGWQVPWATQGQLVMALKYSNILQSLGLEIEFIGFPYGGPLNRAALAGEIDILLTADQPAITLLANSSDFTIAARMMYNRICLYVSPASNIMSLADLGGKSIMGPVGAAAERVALSALLNAGIDLSSIHFGYLDMNGQSALLRRSGPNVNWHGVDALYGFDPLPAMWEDQGLTRSLYCESVVSVVVARKEMFIERRKQLENFILALNLAWYLFSRSPEQLNKIFSKESGLNASQAALNIAASVEPNRFVKRWEEVRLGFEPMDYDALTQTMYFLKDRGIINKSIDLRSRIDTSLLETSLKQPGIAKIAEEMTIKYESD